MNTSDIRQPDDLLAYIGRQLAAEGRQADPGIVVDLEPLFRDVFLGGEIKRLDQVVEATAAGGTLLRPVGQGGRRYTLTAEGAARASAERGLIQRLPMWQRVVLVVVIVALALAALAL